MPHERRELISDLYHRALAQAPEERAAFLVEACDGDETLREEVESLLAFEPAAAGLLERPAMAFAASANGAPSMIDRQIGSYTIIAPLGAGGMGEVYRARDRKLGRDVAIKILPAHFIVDPERRARFTREARTLATLNHPHIGAIYGLEDTDGVTALVLELVEGPTLAERLERGALPIPQALAIAHQIAEALEAAHENGIVHRDLKPANIVLQGARDGLSADVRARVLDFGLAKPVAVDLVAGPMAPASGSFSGTEDGRILGTPAYMSPEQARGLAVDKRTDIWAFGCVLFEMLSGRRAFDGDTLSDTLVGVLERDPDWDLLPRDTPPSIRTLLVRSLRKDPRKRLHDIADALIEMDDAANPVVNDGQASGKAGRAPGRTRQLLTWAAGGILAGVLLTAGLFVVLSRRANPAPTPGPASELTLAAPPGSRFTPTSAFPAAIAPDGSHVVLITVTGNPEGQLSIRPMGSTAARLLTGTEGAQNPFWSPDSKQVAFFATGKLKRVAITGGAPVDVAAADGGISNGGGAWNRDGVILFRSPEGHLQNVPATGAETPTPVTALQAGEGSHQWPWFLPDGQHFLFLASGKAGRQLRIGSMTSSETSAVATIKSQTLYAAGHLLFVDDTVMAQRFDPRSRQLEGNRISLGLRVESLGSRQHLSVSETGVLVYEEPRDARTRLAWMDRTGKPGDTIGEPNRYFTFSLSPDGRRVAVSWLGPGGNIDIGVMDLERGGNLRRVTDADSVEFDPAWLRPHGNHLVFNSNRTRGFGLFRRPSDASGTDTMLVQAERGWTYLNPDSSPDGKFLIFAGGENGQNADLFRLALTENAEPSLFFPSTAAESHPGFSPDGRFVTYASNKTGRFEIYVRRFPDATGEEMVSRNGGAVPRWRSDTEIVFVSPEADMMSARVFPGATFRSAIPQKLFGTGVTVDINRMPYDVTRDGRRFLILSGTRIERVMKVLSNWTARLPK